MLSAGPFLPVTVFHGPGGERASGGSRRRGARPTPCRDRGRKGNNGRWKARRAARPQSRPARRCTARGSRKNVAAAEDNRNWVTETFVGMVDDRLQVDTLASIEYMDGTATEYLNSAEDEALISKEKYDNRRNNILGSSALQEKIVLSKDRAVCQFTDEEALKNIF